MRGVFVKNLELLHCIQFSKFSGNWTHDLGVDGIMYYLGLDDVYQIGIRRCLQWNIMMDDGIGGGVRGVPKAWIRMQKGTENK